MNKTTLSLAVAGLLITAGAVSAAEVTDTFDVSANVVAACFIDLANDMAFVDFSPVSGNVLDSTTTVDVRCTNGHAYDIGLSMGGNAIESQRRMAGQAEAVGSFLNYELYSDVGRETAWGDAGDARVPGTGNGAAETFTIYGQIASGQTDAVTGTYADIIDITVTY